MSRAQVQQWRTSGTTLPASLGQRLSAVLRALRDAGAPLLLGTDAPNPWIMPGFAIHEELRHLVDAGLSPYEALRAGTRDAARFLEVENDFGTISVGKRADLLLVDANPLDNVANVSHRLGVMARGRWYTQADLFARLEALAQTRLNP
jgi:imidazolonepropionase-like amidohydrolase